MTSSSKPLIVIGIDGSDESKEALRWAADYAHLVGGRLRAVTAWRQPTGYYGYAMPLIDADIARDMRTMVETTVADTLGPDPAVPLEIQVTEGGAAKVLLDAADEADLLVVGPRGHGGFAGLLLGSVSSHCVHHAHCPVVVVRSRKRGH